MPLSISLRHFFPRRPHVPRSFFCLVCPCVWIVPPTFSFLLRGLRALIFLMLVSTLPQVFPRFLPAVSASPPVKSPLGGRLVPSSINRCSSILHLAGARARFSFVHLIILAFPAFPAIAGIGNLSPPPKSFRYPDSHMLLEFFACLSSFLSSLSSLSVLSLSLSLPVVPCPLSSYWRTLLTVLSVT